MRRPLRFLTIALAAIPLFLPCSGFADAETGSLLEYRFEKGSRAASPLQTGIAGSPLRLEEKSLAGLSPLSSQLYFLLHSSTGSLLPQTESEALESPHYISFTISPEGGASPTLQELSFRIGARSPRAQFQVQAVAVVSQGGRHFTTRATFSSLKGELQESPSLVVTPGMNDGELPSIATVSLSDLPAPLTEEAVIRLYIYCPEITEGSIPPGTNYSVRISHLAVRGKF